MKGSPTLEPGSVDALLFDLGGVVIDIDFERVFARWAAHAGCEVAAIRAAFRPGHDYECHERGEIDAAGYFAKLRPTLGLDLSEAQFLDGWQAIFGGEIAGMRALLERAAQRLPLYVFSNTNAAHQAFWSQRYGDILGVFRRVFVSCELRLRKPDPEAFRTVAKAMGVPIERVAFFDDSPENVAGARASGMRAVHVRAIADVEAALRRLI